jgi:TPP-dependent indolepyruvate ferredoxin oxidoreductase alpha subunit
MLGLLRYPAIDEARCQNCAPCLALRACRSLAIVRFDRSEPPLIDMARCQRCFVCLGACPFAAISLLASS